MDSKEIISSGILELYVLGQTTAEENLSIKRWAEQYPEVMEEMRAIQLSLEKFAVANAIEPPKGLKEKLLAKIAETGNLEKQEINSSNTKPAAVFSIFQNWKMIAAASIVFLVISSVFNYIYFSKLNNANLDLAQTKKLLEKERQFSDGLKTDWDIVRDPNNIAVSLKGLETNPDATAKIFWFQQSGEVMIDASNLPETPSGMQYQFWAIIDGKPVDGGLIITTNKGAKYRMQKMKSFGKAQAFAISLEKEGGNTIPTQVVSVGKIS